MRDLAFLVACVLAAILTTAAIGTMAPGLGAEAHERIATKVSRRLMNSQPARGLVQGHTKLVAGGDALHATRR